MCPHCGKMASEPRVRLHAKVPCDSIFSTLPGMARKLTVIEGEGLVLQAGELTQNAARNAPVSFAGATPITGRLYDGPVQNFNVIYDPRLTAAGVQILDAGLTTVLPARLTEHTLCIAWVG